AFRGGAGRRARSRRSGARGEASMGIAAGRLRRGGAGDQDGARKNKGDGLHALLSLCSFGAPTPLQTSGAIEHVFDPPSRVANGKWVCLSGPTAVNAFPMAG